MSWRISVEHVALCLRASFLRASFLCVQVPSLRRFYVDVHKALRICAPERNTSYIASLGFPRQSA